MKSEKAPGSEKLQTSKSKLQRKFKFQASRAGRSVRAARVK
jgi:hypothetical protein